jgi:hypothetical protein
MLLAPLAKGKVVVKKDEGGKDAKRRRRQEVADVDGCGGDFGSRPPQSTLLIYRRGWPRHSTWRDSLDVNQH